MNYKDIFIPHLSMPDFNQIWMSVIAIFLVMSIEFVAVGKERSTVYKLFQGNLSKSLKQDIVIWILDTLAIWLLIGKIITLGATFYFAANMNQWISSISPMQFIPYISSLPVQILLYLLLADFVGYWLHRIFHQIQPLWILHKFHHRATEMGIFTARRDNPLVVPLFIIFTGLPVALFGVPSQVPLWITFFAISHALIIHSQILSNWGFIDRWIIVSPYMHRVHHSIQTKHFNKNFAFMFPIWDHIFGTYYSNNDIVLSVGVNEQMTEKSTLKQLLTDTHASINLMFKPFLVAKK